MSLLAFCIFSFFVYLGSAQELTSYENCTVAELSPNITFKLNIWILVPFGKQYKFSKTRIELVVEKALNDVEETFAKLQLNKTFAISASSFSVVYTDTGCNEDKAPQAASDIHDTGLLEQCSLSGNSTIRDFDVIIGMSCDYPSGRVATLASHWNWPMIYAGPRTSSFDQKNGTDCCATMLRPATTRSDLGRFVVQLFNEFQWNISILVYSKYNSHGTYVGDQQSTDCGTQIGGITSEFIQTGWAHHTFYDLIDRDTDADIERDAVEILNDINSRARVSIWCVGKRTMRKVMAAAAELGLTNGEDAFLYIDLYNQNSSFIWTDTDDHLSSDTSNKTDTSDFNAPHTEDSLRPLLVIALTTPKSEAYKKFSDSIKRDLTATYNGTVMEYDECVNPFIGYYYDAMLLFMHGILRMVCSGATNLNDGKAFARNLWGIEYESLERIISISETGDREMDYSVLDMNVTTKSFEVIMQFSGQTQTLRRVGEIDWPGAATPLNIPLCGFQNEFCPPPTLRPNYATYYIIGACAGVILLACAIMTVLFRRMQKEKQLRLMIWRVKWDEIDFSKKKRMSITGSRDSSHSLSSSNGGFNSISKQVFTKTACYKGNVVAVKKLKRRKVSLDHAILVELEAMFSLDHNHICKFVGAVDESPNVSILTEYCARGSLQDLLENEAEYEMDDVFKNSLINDIIKGMVYIHRSYFQYHGNLKSSNCLIDSRFVVKLTDFGLRKFREGSRTDSVTGFKYYENKLWSAPEILRNEDHGSQKSDVYSFAIITQEIIYRMGVFFCEEDYAAQEILFRVTSPNSVVPFRPTLHDNDDVIVDSRLRKLVRRCWSENPLLRPTFQEILRDFKKIHKEKNLVDSLLERLENYSQHLEDKVEERTEQYKAEKERADTLLYQMLPQTVAEQLKGGNIVLPNAYDSVTIFFSDIVGFTAISHGSEPMQVVNMLNDLYTMFDRIIDKFDVYKVETIGDAYMVVSGLPAKNGKKHAREIARMSLSLLDGVLNSFKIRHMPDTQLKLRIGIHTGPVVAGVVGLKMPRYCLFGDTVNTASRMESNGQPFSIHVSPKTKEILDQFDSFILDEREDEVFLKGLGNWKTWWLKGEKPSPEETTTKTKRRLSAVDSSNSTKPAVTFEMESQGSFVRLPTDKNDNTRLPTSIIKHSPRLQHRKHSKKIANRKRHRSGVVLETADVIVTPKQTHRKLIEQHLSVIDEHNDSKENHTSLLAAGRTVQFQSISNAKTVAQKLPEERRSGRDSGIGLGLDNASYIDNFTSDEVDVL